MKIDTSFMDKDPAVWDNDDIYLNLKNNIKYIQVVNDPAERALSSAKNVRAVNEDIFQNTVISKSYDRIKSLENNFS